MDITASYGDGRSARRHPVVLSVATGQLRVRGDGIDASYPLSDVRLTEPFAHAAAMAYFPDGAHCALQGDQRDAFAVLLGRRPSAVVRWQRRWPVALAALVALVAVVASGTYWGIPMLADRLADALPPTVDQHIGASTLQTFTQKGWITPTRLTAEDQAAIQQAWLTVQPAQPRVPLHLAIHRMHAAVGPNAMALTDGTVILNDAMAYAILDDAEQFDANTTAAMAGVLAHEIGHIQRRHGMRALVRASLTAAATGFLFGDFSAVAAGAPAVVLNAHHSRAMETEADAYAMAALRAHRLPLLPLAALFETLADDEPDSDDAPGWFSTATGYLSSHPGALRRAALLRGGAPRPVRIRPARKAATSCRAAPT